MRIPASCKVSLTKLKEWSRMRATFVRHVAKANHIRVSCYTLPHIHQTDGCLFHCACAVHGGFASKQPTTLHIEVILACLSKIQLNSKARIDGGPHAGSHALHLAKSSSPRPYIVHLLQTQRICSLSLVLKPNSPFLCIDMTATVTYPNVSV